MAKSRRKPHTKAASKSGHTPTPAPANKQPLDWLIICLASLGMLITAYLTWVGMFGSNTAFCAEGSGCDIVQQSRWSTVLGLPVALWGLLVYTAILLFAVRAPLRLKYWKRLWRVTLIGLAISLYLTVAGIVALDAVCLWCLASLATITAIFISVTIRRPESAPGMPWQNWALNNSVILVMILALLHVYYSGLLSPRADPRLTALAEHLDDRGVKYYGAYWCPSCQEQSDLFGAAAEKLPYVECNPNGRQGGLAIACRDNEIEGFPTWVINKRKIQGILKPQELADYTGFDWEGFER